MTTVIHIKDAPKDYLNNSEYVFCGRPSKWGNKFIIGKDGTRDEVCDKYKEYLLSRPDLLNSLDELFGKILVCYCKSKPEIRCHCDELAYQANMLEDQMYGDREEDGVL